MRNVSDKSCREIKTHFMFNNFFPGNRNVYEIRWKNTVEPDRPQMTIYYGAENMQEYIYTLIILGESRGVPDTSANLMIVSNNV
jgi:hypothetical protein